MSEHPDIVEVPPRTPHPPAGAPITPVAVGQPLEDAGLGTGEGEWADVPCYVISIASRMLGMHAQTLRAYERLGLVTPARSKGNIRLYRRSDIDRLRLIQRLMSEHGMNLAGVSVVLSMQARIASLEIEVARLGRELARREP